MSARCSVYWGNNNWPVPRLRSSPPGFGASGATDSTKITKTCAPEPTDFYGYNELSFPEITQADLVTFAVDRVNLKQDDAAKYRTQVNNLREDLNRYIEQTYAVARVKRAVMSDDEYTSKGFDFDHFHKDPLAVYREGEIAKVEINIKEPIASYISERQWHPSQRSVRTASGVRLSLEVRVNDELVRWILGMGSNAEVIGPQKLREQMSEEVQRLASSYNKKAS